MDGEVSSSDLDISKDHPHRNRTVVHPNMITIPAIRVQFSEWDGGTACGMQNKSGMGSGTAPARCLLRLTGGNDSINNALT